ncbi:hypothetical protein SteCoe_19330 [Stentor coeruleus]|uniref:Uncharacterized protein n=1 Tax=Stentor coeruleus TaxID=5963 RepID=A0A1R2BV20_9CILI|nr:hypothetical protein SteCoe_19330 [Stentor coeruleus]
MISEETMFLVCWANDKSQNEKSPIKWLQNSHDGIQEMWNFIINCSSGDFFLRLLSEINPNYFHIPYASEIISDLFKQISKFFEDHFLNSQEYCIRLSSIINLELGKIELLETIFLISFITSLYQESCLFSETLCYDRNLPKVLKLSFSILLKAINKLKILESNPTTIKPSQSIKNPHRISKTCNGKRRRQEELLDELEVQRSTIFKLKKKLKEKEEELETLVISSNNIGHIEKFDIKVFTKMRVLEETLWKNREAFDDKNKKIHELTNEIHKLEDQIDLIKYDKEKLEIAYEKLQSYVVKIDNYQKIEKENTELKKKLKESYHDKETLLIEINYLKVNKKRAEMLENQISSLHNEKYEITKELSDLKTNFNKLKEHHIQQSQLLSQIPILKEEISFLKNQNNTSTLSSQRTSIAEENEKSLFVEELECKIETLNRDNKQLTISIQEKENLLNLLQQMQTLGTSSELSMLRQSKLEYELYEHKLNSAITIEDLKKQKNCMEEIVEDIKIQKKIVENELEESKNEVKNTQKKIEELNRLMENLRNENIKLREINTKLRIANESKLAMKNNENIVLEYEKLKNEYSETLQLNCSLKAENKYLEESIEKKRKKANLQVRGSQGNKGNNSFNEAVNGLDELQRLLESFNVCEEIRDKILNVKEKILGLNCIDNDKESYENIINELKNKMNIEASKKYDAERKCLNLIRHMRDLEGYRQ